MNIITPGINLNLSTELNENFIEAKPKILEIDTSTDLNFSQAVSSGTQVLTNKNKNYTFSSSDLEGKSYINIKLLGTLYSYVRGGNAVGGATFIRLNIIKDPTGTPSNILTDFIISYAYTYATTSESRGTDYSQGCEYLYTLTNDDKTDGITIQLKLEYPSTNDLGDVSYTNNQIIFKAY